MLDILCPLINFLLQSVMLSYGFIHFTQLRRLRNADTEPNEAILCDVCASSCRPFGASCNCDSTTLCHICYVAADNNAIPVSCPQCQEKVEPVSFISTDKFGHLHEFYQHPNSKTPLQYEEGKISKLQEVKIGILLGILILLLTYILQTQEIGTIWSRTIINKKLFDFYGSKKIPVKTIRGDEEMTIKQFLTALEAGDIVALVDVPSKDDFKLAFSEHNKVITTP
jgi:hypothetical protein